MWPNPQETADLVTFAEEILNGKLHFLCSVGISNEVEKLYSICLKYRKTLLEQCAGCTLSNDVDNLTSIDPWIAGSTWLEKCANLKSSR